MRVSEADAGAESLERKLATILSADVAAYSRLMAEDEEHTLRTFRGHKQVFEKLVVLHNGRVFNTAGDAILAEFASAVEAVRCATEIQAALRTRNDQLAESRRVEFRMGVNLGDVMVQGDDLLGDGVNVAARLQAAAEPGGVCIAGSVYDQIRNKLSLSFKPLGEMSYKNIPQPVRTFAIAGADGIGPLPAPPTRRRQEARIVRFSMVAGAIVLLLGAAAAVWGFSEYRSRTARTAAPTARLATFEARREQSQTEAAKIAQQQLQTAATAPVERGQAEEASRHPNGETDRHAEPSRLAAAAPVPTTRAAPPAIIPEVPVSSRPNAVADLTGIYRGPICYGAFAAEPARCLKAQVIVTKNKISGQWPAAIRGATMYLAGDITRAGAVVIHMHAQRADGSHGPVADMVGNLRDGHIEASGAFLNGRTVKLNWQKE